MCKIQDHENQECKDIEITYVRCRLKEKSEIWAQFLAKRLTEKKRMCVVFIENTQTVMGREQKTGNWGDVWVAWYCRKSVEDNKKMGLFI